MYLSCYSALKTSPVWIPGLVRSTSFNVGGASRPQVGRYMSPNYILLSPNPIQYFVLMCICSEMSDSMRSSFTGLLPRGVHRILYHSGAETEVAEFEADRCVIDMVQCILNIFNAHWVFLEGGVLVIGAPNNTRGILTNVCWCVATLIADFFIIFRMFIVWKKNYWIMILPFLLWLANFGVTIWSMYSFVSFDPTTDLFNEISITIDIRRVGPTERQSPLPCARRFELHITERIYMTCRSVAPVW
ncbi:hypothetical protein B0H14DRAFT_2610149 [Mycena olivaceomarginata]|nr:hypothetical protein B0H14DRAFT_2610149 [Mycena olivaceomarginata]